MIKTVTIFCGSSKGNDAIYEVVAKSLASAIAKRGLKLVYGGAHVGLMGMIADAALQAGGEVIGVIPRQLVESEIAHDGLSQLFVVETMHERKEMMAKLSDAFIAIPGGFGTMDEFFEMVTWAALGIHKKPCALLDCNDFYADLKKWIDRAVKDGFIKPVYRDMLIINDNPEKLLSDVLAYTHTVPSVW